MKILLATDGSSCSELAVKEVCERQWPEGSEVEVLVLPEAEVPLVPDLFLLGAASHYAGQEHELQVAEERAQQAAARIRDNAPALQVHTKVINEIPKKAIVQEARDWGADLIVVGSHGRGPVKRLILGSVSQAVASQAPCSVEIVKPKYTEEQEYL